MVREVPSEGAVEVSVAGKECLGYRVRASELDNLNAT